MQILSGKRKHVLMMDGAMGTMLMREGLKSGECPELWNVTKAKIIQRIQRQYLTAGAKLIETHSFGANAAKLEVFGLEKKTYALNIHAAQNARKAVQEIQKAAQENDVYILGSIGPSGKFLKPYGDITGAQLQKVYTQQVKGLAAGGVDGFIVETMMSIEEAKAIVREIRKRSLLPVIVTFTFDRARKNYFTLMGETPEKCAAEFKKLSIQGLGANCSLGIDDVCKIIMAFRKCSSLPLFAQPNAGMPQIKNNKTIYPHPPSYFAKNMRRFVSAGASFIGGCCGTTPEHIKAMNHALKEK